MKKIESKNRKVTRKNKKRRIILLSKCTVFDSKKSKFIKQQVVNELLNSLAIKAALIKIPYKIVKVV